MKKILVLSSLAALTAFGYSCSPKASKSSTKASSKAVSAEILAQGKEISETKCGKCHRLHETTEYNADQWTKILDRMIPKARLADDQGNVLRQYYEANAKKG